MKIEAKAVLSIPRTLPGSEKLFILDPGLCNKIVQLRHGNQPQNESTSLKERCID